MQGCIFTDNGTPDGAATHAVLAGALDLLRVERSVFERAHGGNHIVSAARRTELADSRLADTAGRVAGPLAVIFGDTVTLTGNSFDPDAVERPGVVLVTGDADALEVRGKTFWPGRKTAHRWCATGAEPAPRRPAIPCRPASRRCRTRAAPSIACAPGWRRCGSP